MTCIEIGKSTRCKKNVFAYFRNVQCFSHKCELVSNYVKHLAACAACASVVLHLQARNCKQMFMSKIDKFSAYLKSLAPVKVFFPVLFCACFLVLIAQRTRELFSVSFPENQQCFHRNTTFNQRDWSLTEGSFYTVEPVCPGVDRVIHLHLILPVRV